jgi:nucleoside phosphorylase/CheY-like chemotaxis protein
MRLLVVEDDQEKLRRVVLCLRDAGLEDEQVEIARDLNSAKRLLRSRSFDLLILDIALPESAGTSPSKDAGIKFLDELFSRDVYIRPREIIGLTGYVDVLTRAGDRFREDLWTVLFYEPSSDDWIEHLQRKVRYIALASRDKDRNEAPPGYESHLCVLTALASPELAAVLELPWHWEKLERSNDATIYHVGRFERGGETFKVVGAAAPRMGMPAAAVLSMKMIEAFRPRYLAITGILAGLRGQCNVGDVIVADPSWDYGNGKRAFKDGISSFLPSPHQIPLDAFLRSKLAYMSQDVKLLDEIRRSWSGRPAVKNVLTMRIGPVASGAAVLTDPSVTSEVVAQHRKLIGLEMESYGVFAAASECTLPQPKVFSIKSVCDFADESKDDDWQAYASYTSVQALRAFMEQYL